MPGNRKAAIAVAVTWIDKILPGSPNTAMTKAFLEGLSDKEFDAFIEKIEAGQECLPIQVPLLGEHPLNLERNFAIARELKHEFFERIWMDEGNDIPRYLTNPKYMVVDLPLRRQSQLLKEKVSIPKNNNTVDNLTGQPTGSSKGAKISYPELQVMAAMGLDENITELIKYRGGDLKGFNAMNASISKTGGVDMRQLDKLGTSVRSSTTLRTYLTAMHFNVEGL